MGAHKTNANGHADACHRAFALVKIAVKTVMFSY
jgi:hypothetical protein